MKKILLTLILISNTAKPIDRVTLATGTLIGIGSVIAYQKAKTKIKRTIKVARSKYDKVKVPVALLIGLGLGWNAKSGNLTTIGSYAAKGGKTVIASLGDILMWSFRKVISV